MFKPGFILFILIGEVTLPYIWCYSDSTSLANTEYCKTMEILHNTTAQTSDPPFTIEPLEYEAQRANEEVTVTFRSQRPMAGILLDARTSEDSNPDGNFTTMSVGVQYQFVVLHCEGKQRVTFAHNDSTIHPKFTQFAINWVAPSPGTFFFRAAVVENASFYWARVPIPSPEPSTTPTTEPIPTTSATTKTPTVTPSITPSTTKAPLNCSNGGELLNGVCICPDEWTGETCTLENFCKENNLETFTFPRTVIGLSAYSKQTCGDGTENVGVSIATARCLNTTAGKPPTFAQLQKMNCGLTLDDLLKNITGPIDEKTAQKLATDTQMLTSKPEALTSSKISSAAQIVTTILTSGTITKDTATSAVTTVSQLLSADSKQYSGIQGDATINLTRSIEELSKKPVDGLSQVVQPKLVIQTTQVKQSKGVQFRALSGASSDFSANRIQVNDASEMTESEIPSEVEIFVKFSSAGSKTNPINVGFALYDNGAFFQSSATKSLQGTSRVISAQIGAKVENVQINFRPPNDTDKVLEHFECVFWDYDADRWSETGCQRVGTNLSSLQCQCNHTTNFAVLMSFVPIDNKNVATALNWIGIIGCSMSILGVSVTLIYQIVTRKARRNAPTVLLACLCASMIIYNLTFIVGIDKTDSEVDGAKSSRHLDSRNEQRDKGPCTVVTVLLQYFLLATFSFNTLYAADLLLVLRMTLTKRRRSGHFTTIYMLLGWGFPAVMVAISLAVSYRVDNPHGYRREKVCWLAATDEVGKFDFSKPMLWGFLVPMSTMLLFNTAVLMYFAFLSFRQPIVNSSKNAALKKKLLSNFSLGVVLGLTWVLGYLVMASSHAEGLHIFLNFAFSLLVSTQGVQIFILFTARSTLFRKTTSRAVKSISEISIHRSEYSMRKWNSNLTTAPSANGGSDDSYGIHTTHSESSM